MWFYNYNYSKVPEIEESVARSIFLELSGAETLRHFNLVCSFNVSLESQIFIYDVVASLDNQLQLHM